MAGHVGGSRCSVTAGKWGLGLPFFHHELGEVHLQESEFIIECIPAMS